LNNFDWYKIKFLESTSNLKSLIKESTGRTPSTKVAREIAICIQQGRMFFETASTSPIETRPLQLFYGMVGFAKALTIAKNMKSLETLNQSHGLRDISEQNSKIENLCAKINGKGTFQQFNDIVAPMNRGCFHKENSTPVYECIPSATFDDLDNLEINLKDIFSRTAEIESLYQDTFSESANTHSLILMFLHEYDGYCQIRIDDSGLFKNRESLKVIVEKWRETYPFLKKWRIEEAVHAWGNSIIEFGNVDVDGLDDLSEEHLIEKDNKFQTRPDLQRSSIERTNFLELLPPLSGGFNTSHQYMTSPLNGLYMSEFSLQYVGMFLLSSVVCYRPHTWVNAITSYASENTVSDDRALALVEQYMDLCSNAFPEMVSKIINPHEDKHSLSKRSTGSKLPIKK